MTTSLPSSSTVTTPDELPDSVRTGVAGNAVRRPHASGLLTSVFTWAKTQFIAFGDWLERQYDDPWDGYGPSPCC